MKKGWETKKIRDVSDIFNGGTPDTKVPKYWGGDILWITPKDMGKLESIYVDDTARKITDAGLKNSSARILPPNSVILSSRAPIGHLAINTKEICTNQGCRGIVPKKGLSTLYLYYFLENSVELLNSLGTGTTFKELSASKLAEIEIPVPPLPEQQRIVSVLDEAFASIAQAKSNAERNLVNARELFDSVMEEIFGNGNDWVEKKLFEIGDTQTGTTPKTSEKKNYGDYIPFIKPADIDISGDGEIRYDNEGLSEMGLQNGRLMSAGSVLMVCIGASIGKVGFADRDVSCNQQINAFTVNKPNYPKFFYYALRTQGFYNKVIKNSAQATLPIINKSKWENLSIRFPESLAEQRAIVGRLEALSAETGRLEEIYRQKIESLEELKKSVLQKAFSGEL